MKNLFILLISLLTTSPAWAQFTFQPSGTQTIEEVSLGSFSQGSTLSPSIVLLFKNTSALTASMPLSLSNNSAGIFKVALNRCNSVLPNKSCQVTITASNIRTLNGEPSPGTKYQALFSYNNPSSTVPVSLTVIGSLPPGGTPVGAYTFSPASLSFSSSVSVGSITLNNASNVSKAAALTAIGSIPMVAGRFSISSTTCANPIPAASSCIVSVSFNSTGLAEGTYVGSLNVGSDFIIPLSATVSSSGSSGGGGGGSGLPVEVAAEVSDASLIFTPTVFRYVTQAVSVSNVSSTAFSPSVTLSGADASSFNVAVNRCTGSLNSLKVCTIILRFDTKNASVVKNAQLNILNGASVLKTVSLTGEVVPLVKRTLTLMAANSFLSQTEVTINPNSNGEVNLPVNSSAASFQAKIPDGSDIRVRISYDNVKVNVLSSNPNCVLVSGTGYKECNFTLSSNLSLSMNHSCVSPYVLDVENRECILPNFDITILEERNLMSTGSLSYRVNDGIELPLLGTISVAKTSKLEILKSNPDNGSISLSIDGFTCNAVGCVINSLDAPKAATANYVCNATYFNNSGTCDKRTLTIQTNQPDIAKSVLNDNVSFRYAAPSTSSLVEKVADLNPAIISNLDDGASVLIQVTYDAISSSVSMTGFSSCDENNETSEVNAAQSVLDLVPGAKVKTCVTTLNAQKVIDINFTCNAPNYRLIGSTCQYAPDRSYLSISIEGATAPRQEVLDSISRGESQTFFENLNTYGTDIGKIWTTSGVVEVFPLSSASQVSNYFYAPAISGNLGFSNFEFYSGDFVTVHANTIPLIYYNYDSFNFVASPSSVLDINWGLGGNSYCNGMGGSGDWMYNNCIKRYDYGSFMVWYDYSTGLLTEPNTTYEWKIKYCDDAYGATFMSNSPPMCMPVLTRYYSIYTNQSGNSGMLPDVYYFANSDYVKGPYLEVRSEGLLVGSQRYSFQQSENQNNQGAWQFKKIMPGNGASMGDYNQSLFVGSHSTNMWLEEDFSIRILIPAAYNPSNGPGEPINNLADMGLEVDSLIINNKNLTDKLPHLCPSGVGGCTINKEMMIDQKLVRFYKDNFNFQINFKCSVQGQVFYPELSKCVEECASGEVMTSKRVCCPYETPYWDWNNNQCAQCPMGQTWDGTSCQL